MQSPENDDLVDRFLAGSLANDRFTHAMHVEVGWRLLNRLPYLDALMAYASTIRRMAESDGAPHKFNATITVAFLALIAEHMRANGRPTWAEFIAANPTLLDKTLLKRWYAPERLASPSARVMFLMPEPSRAGA